MPLFAVNSIKASISQVHISFLHIISFFFNFMQMIKWHIPLIKILSLIKMKNCVKQICHCTFVLQYIHRMPESKIFCFFAILQKNSCWTEKKITVTVQVHFGCRCTAQNGTDYLYRLISITSLKVTTMWTWSLCVIACSTSIQLAKCTEENHSTQPAHY